MLPDGTIHPERMLAHYGKSFHWAAFFLNKTQLTAARHVYAFCRFVDDLVDEADDKALAQQHLDHIKQAIESGHSPHPIIHGMLQLIHDYQINKIIVLQLLDGVAWDLTGRPIDTQATLMRYSYGVASTVGLMMCPILGVTHPLAYRFAIDLGIAMQLTNIARDVRTDAKMQRIYLPQTWFTQPMTPTDILTNPHCRTELFEQIIQLLTLADHYYHSADDGLSYLPRRARVSIIIASRVYQAIGAKIITQGEMQYWRHARVYTRKREKVWLSLRAVKQLMTGKKYRVNHACRAHTTQLHEPIKDLIQDAL